MLFAVNGLPDQGSERPTPRTILMAPRRRVGRTRLLQVAGITGLALVVIAITHRPETLVARTADPTFARDVAPILYKNCTTCHRPGGQGPFTLLDYDTAVVKKEDIRDAVSSGFMPPWHAE